MIKEAEAILYVKIQGVFTQIPYIEHKKPLEPLKNDNLTTLIKSGRISWEQKFAQFLIENWVIVALLGDFISENEQILTSGKRLMT